MDLCQTKDYIEIDTTETEIIRLIFKLRQQGSTQIKIVRIFLLEKEPNGDNEHYVKY